VAAGSASLLSPGTQLCHPDDVQRLRRAVTAKYIIMPLPCPPGVLPRAAAGDRP